MSNKIATIKERILYILEVKGIVKDKFFLKIGMTYGNFTGKAKFTPLNSTAISNILSEIPDLSPDWLLIGTGPMFRDECPAHASPTVIYERDPRDVETIADKNKIIKLHEEAIASLRRRIAELEGRSGISEGLDSARSVISPSTSGTKSTHK